ncbi:MAG: DUF4290 domain-containing protein [Chitinophagaceae bacterium]|nr:DUF4290 domain-containing protein [Chitinophagaceae bacterium]
MEYNTTRNHLIIREYGRHIQKMVDYILTIEDREKRTKDAHAIVELMGFLNPSLKQVEDYKHKLWDHLYIISDFKLDVDSPYPKPERETYNEKPAILPYPKKYPKYNHLGKNLESLIDKAMKEEDPDKKQGLANTIAYYMKLTYSNWHKELVHDDSIQAELSALTNGQLEFDNKPFIRHRNPINREDFVSNIGKSRKSYSRNNRGDRGGRGRKFGGKRKY